MKNDKNNRRNFLFESGKLAGAGWLALNAPLLLAAGKAAAEQRAAGAGWANLTAGEAESFAAVADQILPPDDLPGAAEAGVVYFIDQALGGFMAEQSAALKSGLADLDRLALQSVPQSGGFAGLRFEQQTVVLQQIEDTPFFGRMIFLTHCGMFAMPSWGGNRDLAGWALLGFDARHAWEPPFGFYDAGHHGGNPVHAGTAEPETSHGHG